MFQHFKIVGCWSILRSGRKICELELTGTSLITVLLSVPYDMVTLKLRKWKIFFPTLKLKGMLNVDVVLLSVRYDMVSFSLRKCKKKFLNLNLSERWMLMYHCFVECPIWYGELRHLSLFCCCSRGHFITSGKPTFLRKRKLPRN